MSCSDALYLVGVVTVLVPFAVYLSVRLGAAAYFRSKRDHDQLKGN